MIRPDLPLGGVVANGLRLGASENDRSPEECAHGRQYAEAQARLHRSAVPVLDCMSRSGRARWHDRGVGSAASAQWFRTAAKKSALAPSAAMIAGALPCHGLKQGSAKRRWDESGPGEYPFRMTSCASRRSTPECDHIGRPAFFRTHSQILLARFPCKTARGSLTPENRRRYDAIVARRDALQK